MTTPDFTIVGARGFVGGHLLRHLLRAGFECAVPTRDEELRNHRLGHVIYCAGVTGDFRTRPFDTIEAHILTLARLLRTGEFESLVYLSSTRVYKRHGSRPACETDVLQVDPTDLDDLYGLSKLTGESVALAGSDRTRIVRLSHVYSEQVFDGSGLLPDVLRDAVTRGAIDLRTSPESSRDFVSIEDVVDLLPRIARAGTQRVYNLASGVNIANATLAGHIARLTGCGVHFEPGAPIVAFPEIDIGRIRIEFGTAPASLLDALPRLVGTATKYWSDRVIH